MKIQYRDQLGNWSIAGKRLSGALNAKTQMSPQSKTSAAGSGTIEWRRGYWYLRVRRPGHPQKRVKLLDPERGDRPLDNREGDRERASVLAAEVAAQFRVKTRCRVDTPCLQRECKHCGKALVRCSGEGISRFNRRIFCDSRCRAACGPPMVECPQCRKPFPRKKKKYRFCSPRCAHLSVSNTVDVFGVELTLREAADLLGVSPITVRWRIKRHGKVV